MEFFNPRRSFVILVLFSLLAFVTWSSIASIDTIVRANGRIVPAGKSQIVQHLEGGIVKKILVQEGEVVKAGQSLMELADVQARSSLGQEKTNLSSLRGREARLLAEATGQGKINFPKDLVDEEVKAAEIAAFNARRARLSEEARVLRDQSAQKRGDISEAESRRRNLLSELDVAKQQYRVIEGLNRDNAASHLELLDSQSRVQKLSSQIAEAESMIPRLRAAVSETESRVGELWAR